MFLRLDVGVTLVAFSALSCAISPHHPLPSSTAKGQDEPQQRSDIFTRDRLSGDWGGLRPRLDEAGLDTEIHYTIEVMRVVDGGVRRSTEVLGNLDLLLTANLDTLVGWRNATAFLYGLANHGDNPSEAVGDFQAVSNIEAPEAFRLFEAWIEQSWFDQRISALVGLYDINSEFDSIPAAGVFLHSSHGIGAEFGTSGRNGPSVFPVTSLAARLKLRPSEWSYAHAVVADGVPGNPDEPKHTSVRFENGDGVLLVGEVGVFNLPSEDLRRKTHAHAKMLPPPGEQRYGHFGKFAVGVWGYTGEFDDFSRLDPGGEPVQRTGSHGAYAFAEQQLLYEPEDPRQGLSAFLRVGFADDRVQVLDRYLGGGLVYRGLVPDRGDDTVGLAVAAARFGAEFQRSVAGAGGWHDWEIALELTYRAEVFPWLSLQPDLQYVIHPGGDPQLDDALVIGMRGVVSF